MFWKLLTWGGAIAMIALCVVAYMANGEGGSSGTNGGEQKVEQPAGEPGKKFNF